MVFGNTQPPLPRGRVEVGAPPPGRGGVRGGERRGGAERAECFPGPGNITVKVSPTPGYIIKYITPSLGLSSIAISKKISPALSPAWGWYPADLSRTLHD